MEIRQAIDSELALVEGVLQAAAKRIKATGSTQWRHVLQGEERAEIAQKISEQACFIIREESQVVGVFYLSQTTSPWDRTLWGDSYQAAPTYYLHKLALADAFVQQGRGEKVLRQIQAEWSEGEPAVVLRLDCIATQAYLNGLYQRSQFKQVGTVKNLVSGEVQADFNLYQWQKNG